MHRFELYVLYIILFNLIFKFSQIQLRIDKNIFYPTNKIHMKMNKIDIIKEKFNYELAYGARALHCRVCKIQNHDRTIAYLFLKTFVGNFTS